MPDRARELIGTFAGLQIQASEELRAACNDEYGAVSQIHHLQKAAEHAENAFMAGANVLERALAYEQYKCAAGMLMMVRNGYSSVAVDPQANPELTS